MEERPTKQQFLEITCELNKIIKTIPGLQRNPKCEWDLCFISEVGLQGSVRFNDEKRQSLVHLNVYLQDDSGPSYPVCSLIKFFRPPEGCDTHAAMLSVEIRSIYPHQFAALPKTIEAFHYITIPSFNLNLLDPDKATSGIKLPLVSAELRVALKEAEQERTLAIANNPDNGHFGWWFVQGLRHSAHVKASSAGEAIKRAEDFEIVGDWESPDAKFLGKDLPDIF